MADATYSPKTYRSDGGDKIIVASGGTLQVESGGTLQLDSGATATLADEILAAADMAVADGALVVGNAAGAGVGIVPTGDVTITNAGVTAIGAEKVLSSMVEEGLIHYVDKQLTNAEVLAVRATPITLVAAPGSNKAIIVDKILAVCDSAAAGYTESTDNLAIQYSGGLDILTIESTGFVDGGDVQVRHQAPAEAVVVLPPNEAVEVFGSGDGELGGGNAANTLSFRIWYHTVPTVAFT